MGQLMLRLVREKLRFHALGQRLFGIDAHRILINQMSPQQGAGADQSSGQQRQISPPRQDMGGGIRVAQQPVERGQRQHHHSQYGVAPSGDQSANALYQHQVNQPDHAGHPAATGAHTREPQTRPGPESVFGQNVSKVRANQPNQRRYGEVNQRGVNGVIADRHLAQYGFPWHRLPLLRNGFCRQSSSATWKRLTGLSWVIIPILLSGCAGPFSALDPAGPSARIVLWLWWAMAAYAGAVLVAVVALWLYAIRRKHDEEDSPSTQKMQRRWIIGGGVALPMLSITALLIFGIPAGHKMLPLPPENGKAFRVDVTGHQWWWEVRYPDSAVALVDEIHIPVGVPVDVYLRSADVIHSFWVPRLGGKIDMIPGHTNVLRLQADEPGVYRGQCAEFCGRNHAHMKFAVHAHAQQDFEQWWRTAQEELEADDE